MAEMITMPKLGFDMAEGKLGEWLKKAGDTVTQGETILLVEDEEHLRTLAQVNGEVSLALDGPATQRAVLDALEASLPPGCTFTRSSGGLFSWVTLPGEPAGLDAGEALRSRRRRVNRPRIR